ncbi:MAG: hypothetical protein A2787_07210 [Omnitrophica WOR_2 bacterium RIFCSPHIGHO2_01_FULL_48_9]|nr:MAG: hypothetical protein A3D10_00180 [Omnitrophica WOR_2 bacterium RIFCSPHIGHO2_02_FULL_48_11]OGX32913.1 MAG: hypothetical protein A2787_07210 [Omnitrophica WOR_2 bacterium RIFCSPHIGHO2_01_FULL_48_9]
MILLKEFLNERFQNTGRATADYESPLIKAALIHTARDLDNPGPDFGSGYGEIQPMAAMDILEGNNFVLDTFNNYNKHLVKKYPIPLPAWINVTEPLKITLVYLDHGSTPDNWNKPRDEVRELVNNLNLSFCDATGVPIEHPYKLDWQHPWLPATRGFNDRDNVEQVFVTPEVIRNNMTVQTTHLYACVRFQNYLNSPDVNQKFVLIIGDLNNYVPTCGNGHFEPNLGEECDRVYGGINYGGKTCQDFGGTTGADRLLCTAQCTIDPIRCQSPLCENDRKDRGEMCDPTVNDDSCALGCYSAMEGEGKACKCSCTNDSDCYGTGRMFMVCENGVCQGCGDGELDVNEECDDTSAAFTSQVCAEKYGEPQGTAQYSCWDCGCAGGNNTNTFYMCKGKKVLSKPKCQKDSECGRNEICNPGCRCEPGFRCKGRPVKKRPRCQQDVECGPGKYCKFNCECAPKCGNGLPDAGEECDPPGSTCGGANDGTCDNSCQCVYCGNNRKDMGEECDPPGSACTVPGTGAAGTCDTYCGCVQNETICGNGTVEAGEECEPPGSQCTQCPSNSGTCNAVCQCIDNCGDPSYCSDQSSAAQENRGTLE